MSLPVESVHGVLSLAEWFAGTEVPAVSQKITF